MEDENKEMTRREFLGLSLRALLGTTAYLTLPNDLQKYLDGEPLKDVTDKILVNTVEQEQPYFNINTTGSVVLIPLRDDYFKSTDCNGLLIQNGGPIGVSSNRIIIAETNNEKTIWTPIATASQETPYVSLALLSVYKKNLLTETYELDQNFVEKTDDTSISLISKSSIQELYQIQEMLQLLNDKQKIDEEADINVLELLQNRNFSYESKKLFLTLLHTLNIATNTNVLAFSTLTPQKNSEMKRNPYTGDEFMNNNAFDIDPEKPYVFSQAKAHALQFNIKYLNPEIGYLLTLKTGNKFATRTDLNTKLVEDPFFAMLYDDENISQFEEDIREKEHLKEILELKILVDLYTKRYPKDDPLKLGDFLKQTDWYQRQVDRISGRKQRNDASDIKLVPEIKNLNLTLQLINRDTYKYRYTDYQALQCVAFVILISALKFRDCPVEYIGGQNIRNASELFPTSENFNENTGEAFYDGLKIVNTKTLDSYIPGDIFLRNEGRIGHVGVVLSKKSINGKVYLLCAASNQISDGKIKIFTVSARNFKAVFGTNDDTRATIRKK